MTQGKLIGLVAETPIHVGIGQAADALDLPVAREAVTRYPHVPGSGVKGAFREWSNTNGLAKQTRELFGDASGGEDDGSGGAAGMILCGEARLAMLPVRCTSDAYKLVICPLIINRLLRDLKRVKVASLAVTATVQPGHYLGSATTDGAPLGLEEREFQRGGDLPENLVELLAPLAEHVLEKSILTQRIVVLHDADFKWFAEFALPVATRNALDDNKIVKSGALWSEETLASDTVMWMVLNERVAGKLADVICQVEATPYIQMGGNETIGQGWFSMRACETRKMAEESG